MSLQKYIFLLPCIWLCLALAGLQAQDINPGTSGLHLKLSESSTINERIDLLNEIAYSYRRFSIDSVKYYSELALSEAQKANYKKGLLVAHKNRGIYLYKEGAPANLVLEANSLALQYAIEIEDYDQQARINNNIALVKASQEKYREAIKHFLDGLEIIQEHFPPELSLIEGLINGNIAGSYYQLGNFNQALLHAERCNYISEASDISTLRSMSASVYGSILIALDRVEEAKTYLESIIPLHKELADYQSLGNTLLQLATQAVNEKQYHQAQQYVSEIQLLVASKKFNIFDADLQLIISRIKNGKGDYPAALFATKKAIAIAQENNKYNFEIEGYELLSEVYQNLKRYEDALRVQQHVISARDSLYQLEKSILIEEIATRYSVSQKEQEIKFLQSNEQQQKRLISILGVVIFLGLAFASMVSYSLYSRSKSRLIIEEKNEQLKSYIAQNLQLENFAHIASHDLKSPLRTIISFSQLLSRKLAKQEDPQIQSYLNYITSGSKELTHLTEDLLEYSTLNKTKLELTAFKADEFVQKLLDSIQSTIEEKDANIEVAVKPQLIRADAIKLRQVFQNLLTNAMKFQPEGRSPVIKIELLGHKSLWEFRISDNGIGIKPEFQEQIFLLLKRLHNKDEYEGTGMGLAICKRIVEQHEGTIGVTSVKREGSTFHFTISKNLR